MGTFGHEGGGALNEEQRGERACAHTSRAADGTCFKCSDVDWRMRCAVYEADLRHTEMLLKQQEAPVPIRLHCPECGELHVDVGPWATRRHHTHSCQVCGCTWRPAVVATVGVQFLPGFKNEESSTRAAHHQEPKK